MSKLLVDQKSCKLIEDDAEILAEIDSQLSFEIQGAKYTKAFQGYFDDKTGHFIKWDGKKRLLNGDLTFPRGLLDRIKDIYSQKSKVFDIEYLSSKEDLKSFDILSNLKSINKNPYPYQIDAANTIKDFDCGILRMATGSGKSVVMALMTSLLGKKTIVYVIGKDLLYQLHDLFTKIFGSSVGIVGDGQCKISDINVVSIWTAGQALGLGKKKLSSEADDEKEIEPEKYSKIKELLKTTKAHIFDECHVAACTTIQEIYRAINPEHIYGMSASPWRDDGQDLLIEALLGKYIVDIPASKLIEEGYLIKPTIRFMKVPPSKAKDPYQTIYKNYVIDNFERHAVVIKGTTRLIELGYKPLILFNALNHGNTLFDLLKQKFPCSLLSGKDDLKTRLQARDDLFNGKTKALLASKIFDIGVDIPFISGLVAAGSGKSSVRAMQRIGRVIRKYEGKKSAAVIDFYDQVKFLKQHAEARYRIYSSEKGFDVKL